MAVAKTQQKVNKAQQAFDGANGALSGFARMEEKAQAMLDHANAMADLNERPADPAEELERKYSSGGSGAVEDELAKLKAEMGL